MTALFARPATQLAARIAAVGGVIATGWVYFGSFLIAPMPWPLVFDVIWLCLVIGTILTARRWAYGALVLPLVALAFIAIALRLGQDVLGWAP